MRILIKNNQPSWAYFLHDSEYEQKELVDALTVSVPGARYTFAYKSGRWSGKKAFIDYKKMRFPAGLLPIVKQAIPSAVVADQREYCGDRFRTPLLEGITFRSDQKDALLYAYQNRCCLIHAATNYGKGVIISGLVRMMIDRGYRVLITVHRIELLRQTIEVLEKRLGMDIGSISSDSMDISDKCNVAMYMTLLNKLECEDEVLSCFLESTVLIIDEVHRASSETYSSLLQRSRATYRWGFSGTIPKINSYKGMLVRQWVGDTVFKVTNEELIAKGISAVPHVHMIEYRHVIDYVFMVSQIEKDFVAQGTKFATIRDRKEKIYRQVYPEVMYTHIVCNEKRMFIVAYLIAHAYKEKAVLAIVDILDQGTLFIKILKDTFGIDAEFISGTSSNREASLAKFKSGQLRVLVSSSILDEGVDTDKIRVMVLLGGKKSKRQLLQRIGRGLRKKETDNRIDILDFFDYDGKYLERHSTIRRKIYKKEKFDIEMVRFTGSGLVKVEEKETDFEGAEEE